MLVLRKDVAYSLVIIWALVGISVKQSGNQIVVMATEYGAALVAVLLVVVVLFALVRKK
jgi:hypothetical protein